MKLLAIAGSLRENSYNRQLAEAAGTVMREKHPDVEFEILDWDDVPFMNQDAEHPAPEAVTRARAAVREADGLWLFSPEYNHAIPGPLKNLLDWLSRPVSATEAQVLGGKPVALAGASIGMSGAAHAQDQLVSMLSFLDAHVMNKPRLTIPHIATQADEQGRLELAASAPYLEAQADAFVRFVEREIA
ncbi:NAD(P)H-dependent oxidoreductase [Eggerthella guodeyinii]|uniref:NAD(P)H-dependent oxidoreductase n=2 Tax=Eggerthella TaxID=84111 RepID=A0A6L7IRM5_9ACTN|nr:MULTISPECIES: NADPH-dependent FMN reductase [Eggerthella]MBC5582592.1 NAD(P)H-dependent oxidoreductase [Eggerthella hominis]QOS69535.1 NAD(P)H-dependent oxidoreductase [Eggerthella guodeyinii]